MIYIIIIVTTAVNNEQYPQTILGMEAVGFMLHRQYHVFTKVHIQQNFSHEYKQSFFI